MSKAVRLKVDNMHVRDCWKDMARVPYEHRIDANGKHIHRGSICDVTVRGTSKHTLLAVRGCQGDEARILLDSQTRHELGVKVGESYEVELRLVGWIGYCRWAWNADDPAYRLPAQISLISLFLGIGGLLLGFWPLIHEASK
jgi:hypothetical protein